MLNSENVLDIELFKKRVKQAFGLDFYSQNEPLLINAIKSRTKANNLSSSRDYYRLLTANSRELEELVCLLTINETYFYREAQHLQFLTDALMTKITTSNPDNKPIRILSLGCSTGAEPYSIAIALEQKFGGNSSHSFTLLGADVDRQALTIAKQGHYHSHAFRGLDPALKQRYFTEQATGVFALDAQIRKQVSFHYMNIASATIAPEMQNMDIIFFRNVSIYFDHITRQHIQQNIASMLKPNGYLIMGMTESLANDFGLLSLQQQDDLFYFCKTTQPSTHSRQVTPMLQQPLHPTRVVVPDDQADLCCTSNTHATPSVSAKLSPTKNDIVRLLHNKNYDDALTLLNDVNEQSDAADYLSLRAFILFNRQQFDEARQCVQKALALAPLSIDNFLLLGMIAKWQKLSTEAIEWFKKALYLHSDCWPAHYYLAGLYREQGLPSKAHQEYHLVLQQLNNPTENFAHQMIIPLTLPKAEIRLLCQSYTRQVN